MHARLVTLKNFHPQAQAKYVATISLATSPRLSRHATAMSAHQSMLMTPRFSNTPGVGRSDISMAFRRLVKVQLPAGTQVALRNKARRPKEGPGCRESMRKAPLPNRHTCAKRKGDSSTQVKHEYTKCWLLRRMTATQSQ